MKKFIASFLVICTLFMSTVSMAFSDVVSNHWAKNAIENMVAEGIISGYTDGTFRPSRNISKIESLILLSKIAGVNKYPTEASEFETKYASALSSYTTSYKKQVAYLMGVSVLKEADLPNLLDSDKINSPLTREEMAVLITKILGKEDSVKSKSIYILPFKDASKISSSAKGYVEFVYNEGIMNGIDSENFSPDTYVTRAQAAVILNSIYNKVDIKPTVTSNTTVKGEITTIAQALGVMWIEDTTNFEDSYEYNDDTKIYVNGKSAKDTDLKEGMTVEATVVDEVITVLKAESKYDYDIDTTSTSVSGTIVSIEEADDDEYILELKSGSKTKYYIINDDTEFYIDDEDAKLKNFDEDDEVKLKLDDGYVEEMSKESDEVEIDEKSDSAEGTIVSMKTVKKETTIGVKVGSKIKYYIADSDTEYYIDDDETDLDDFYTGDEVELELDDGYIIEMYKDDNSVSIDKTSKTASGTITSIRIGVSQSIVGVKVGSKTKYYIIDDETYLEVDDDEGDIEDFSVGDEVDLELAKGYVDEMVLVEEADDDDDIDSYMIGKITSVDDDDEILKIKVGTSTKTIYTASGYIIIEAESTDELDIDDLAKNDNVAVFGYYKSSKFYANVIVLIEE